MAGICENVRFVSGTPQFRIVEDMSASAPLYYFYGQADLEDDLNGLMSSDIPRKQIRTFDSVVSVSEGDVVFSLLSGTASVVQASHSGFLLTQNYVILVPSHRIDARYLVYLMNENRFIKSQLRKGQQGSVTQKYTLKQIKSLELPPLPSRERQGLIGEVYLSQLKLNALRKRASDLETALVLETIREADHS